MVLFVSYSGELGGAERLLVDYASALARDRVLACPPGPLERAASQAGVTVLRLPGRSPALRGGPREPVAAAARLGAHALEIRRLWRNLRAEVVIAWGMRSALSAGLAGVPFVFAHNDLLPGPAIAAAVRVAARRARAVVALSHASARELGPGVIVLHPGVDVASFAAFDRRPDDPPTVLVLGALVGWKRPDVALEALAIARRRLPDLRLVLAGAPLHGDTTVLESLRARAAAPDLAGAVTFAGRVPEPRAALAAATCLLHCAEREPFGLAVLEALAAARPAIVPASCGPAEIADGTCAVLYQPGDAVAAADAIVSVVSDPALAAEMGRRGRERASGLFDGATARRRFGQIIALAAEGGARDGAGRGTGWGRGTGAREGRPGHGTATDPAARLPRTASARPEWAPPGASLSIVTVTHDSAAQLAALIESAHRHLPGAELIVVDCASSDATLAVARSHAGVRVLALGVNVGFGRACNAGTREATRPVTALLNPDVRLLDGSLELLARRSLSPGGEALLLAPRVLNPDGSLQDTVHPLPGSPADLIRSLMPPAAVPGPAGVPLAPWRALEPRPVGWAVGCALVARTQTLSRLGPFHESLFLYGEDLELGLRARRSGIRTWLEPAAVVVHDRAHSTRAEFGGEPFERLARARHDAIRLARGPLSAAFDDGSQAVTFASRLALKRLLGRAAGRERRQLGAVLAARRGRRGAGARRRAGDPGSGAPGPTR